jgi:membrane-bound ClpP family serine protease
MTALILLFVIGIVLLAADVFVSSFIMAIVGGLAMVGGCFMAYREFGGVGAGIASVASVGLLATSLYLELVVLPRTRLGRGLVIHEKAGSVSQPSLAQAGDVIGRPAEALTVLAPSGYVLVNGRRYEAFSQSGHVPKGTTLRVQAIDNFRLIVTKT